MEDPPHLVRADSVIVHAPDEPAARRAALDWVHAHDAYCDPRIDPLVETTIVRPLIEEELCCSVHEEPEAATDQERGTVYYVESGSSEPLTDRTPDERSARSTARRLRERLIGVEVDPEGNEVNDWLVWDYGAGHGSAGDDPSEDAPDLEQAERDTRDDLCDECRPVDHPTCSMDYRCACCRTTFAALADKG